MQSQIEVLSYPGGEIQRVQLVRLDDWSELDFLHLRYDEPALDCFANIYRQYLVPACPWLFGSMVMFRLPEDLQVEFPFETKRYGTVADRLTAATAALRWGVKIIGRKPVFANAQVKELWNALEKRNCLHIIRGRLPITTIIPVDNTPGYLSRTEQESPLKVNASFFIMDRFDCATVYDQVGTPFGLCVKDGVVTSPPLYGREALLVRKSGSVSVESPELSQLTLEIGGQQWHPGENAAVYSRPRRSKSPMRKGKKLVIIGCRVAAVSENSRVDIPSSGFVLCPEGECTAKPGDRVIYRGMEDVCFGIQVGNSIVRFGEKTNGFRSRFYNIRRLEPIPFPPSLYPMNYRNARAARIALGADAEGKPMLLWAEGAGKLGYVPGRDSRGASLSDMAEICSRLGMINGVNLDGGGSAQILVDQRRALMISGRNPEDNSEAERPVPLGLILRGK